MTALSRAPLCKCLSNLIQILFFYADVSCSMHLIVGQKTKSCDNDNLSRSTVEIQEDASQVNMI